MSSEPSRVSAHRIALLDSPVLLSRGHANVLTLPPRAHTLLALLALRYERPEPRNRLAATLWPDHPDDEARANLRRHLHLIVRALPSDADALLLTKTTAQWNPKAAIDCDLVEFLAAAADPGRLAEAAQLYAGELCAGIADEFLEPLRAEVAARYEAVLRSLAASGDSTSSLLALQRLVERDPLDESSARSLVIARFESGDRAGALREYHALIARLRAELGVDPEPSTAALLDRMLTVESALGTPHNLVAPASSFVGRTAELRGVVDALAHDRVVSLVGPAGIGKTRLAVESAFVTLGRFNGGVYYVALAREHDGAGAMERIARTLDCAPAPEAIDGIVASVRHKNILLVLDNLEQLGDEAKGLIDTLTARTPVRILVTSRRRVHAAGERVIALAALELPPLTATELASLARFGAVRLFLERATAVAPGFRLSSANANSVATILRRLDGNPLAIELVASRANVLTIEGILKRLDSRLVFANPRREERHVTIDGAIAWSYELLTPVEQAVFRRIAVFGGSCTPEALEDVCAPIAADAVGPVSELVETSLLIAEPTGETIRYRTFELTRAFALRLLHELGEYDDAARRHAYCYVGLAEKFSADFKTDGEQGAYLRCDAEEGNFAAALEWSLERDPACAARFMAALWSYWIFRGRARAGEAMVGRLERAEAFDQLPLGLQARVFQAGGMLARDTQLRDAGRYLDKARELFGRCGESGPEIEVLTAIAALHFARFDFEESERRYRTCLALQEVRGDLRAAALTLANLAQLEWLRGDCASALATLDRALEGFRETKNARGIAHVFRTRGVIFETLGRFEEGIAQAQQSVALYESLGEPARVAECLAALGSQYTSAGRLGDAFDAMRRSLELLAEVRNDVYLCNALRPLFFTARRAGEHEAVRRIDTIMRAIAERMGQKPDHPSGTTESAVAAARAALPAAVADAAVESASTMDQDHVLEIVRRLAKRHADSTVDPVRADGSDADRTVEHVS